MKSDECLKVQSGRDDQSGGETGRIMFLEITHGWDDVELYSQLILVIRFDISCCSSQLQCLLCVQQIPVSDSGDFFMLTEQNILRQIWLTLNNQFHILELSVS